MKIKDLISRYFNKTQTKNHMAMPEQRVVQAQLFPEEAFPTFNEVIARPEEDFYLKSYSSEELHKRPAHEIRKIVLASDSTASKAHSNFIQYINQGWSFTPDYTENDPLKHPLYPLFESFFNNLNKGTGLGNIIDMMSDSLFKDAAIFSELVFADDNMTPVDLKILDVNSARFRKSTDPVRGQIYELGQIQAMEEFRSLEEFPTIEYVPLHPQNNNPYGKQILTAGLIFAINKHDYWLNVRQANAAITFPNALMVIDVAKVKIRMGADPVTLVGGSGQDEVALQKEINNIAKNIQKGIEKMGPGGVFVHTDDVKVDGFLSGQNTANMGAVGTILKELRIELIDGLQSQPILHGITNSISETHAKQGIIDYGRFIRNAQEKPEGIITRATNLICVQNGYPPLAKFKLKEPLNIEADRESQSIQHRAEANLSQSEALIKFVEFADQMVVSGYWNQMRASEEIEKEMLRVFYEEEMD